jgi:hypothetical protein
MKAMAPRDEGDKRRLILRLIAQIRCMECGRPYDPHDFVLVQRRQDMWVLSTRCRHCDEPCHVVVFMEPAAEPEPVTDLTPKELEVSDQWPPITADDVLDVHMFLREFEGDFEELFEG